MNMYDLVYDSLVRISGEIVDSIYYEVGCKERSPFRFEYRISGLTVDEFRGVKDKLDLLLQELPLLEETEGFVCEGGDVVATIYINPCGMSYEDLTGIEQDYFKSCDSVRTQIFPPTNENVGYIPLYSTGYSLRVEVGENLHDVVRYFDIVKKVV